MIDIVFHGTPIGKSRPRFGRTKTGGVVTYTPQKTRDYERGLRSRRTFPTRPKRDGTFPDPILTTSSRQSLTR